MSFLVFDIKWGGGAPLPSEWELNGIKSAEDIKPQLESEFENEVLAFEYVEL